MRLSFTNPIDGLTSRSISSWLGTRQSHRGAQPVLVEPHAERRLRRHDADPRASGSHAAQLHRSCIDDVQDRHAGVRAHRVVPAVRGVARDGDRAAAGPLKAIDAAQQPGQRIGGTARIGDCAVRHPRIGPQHGGDMVLIARGRRQLREPHHEVRARQRAHAAEYAQHFVIHAAALAAS
jgi:hypothetical protein